jgi:hypothetical protein
VWEGPKNQAVEWMVKKYGRREGKIVKKEEE